MKKSLFFNAEEKGVALIGVVLTSALVLGLFFMAFTNAIIGNVVSQNQEKIVQSKDCGRQALAIANQVLVQVYRNGNVDGFPNGVRITRVNDTVETNVNARVAVQNPLLDNIVEEIQSNPWLAIDSPIQGVAPPAVYAPNITITLGGCVADVDIDFLFHDAQAEGEDEQHLNASHSTVGGTACGEGDFYAITAVTRMVNNVGVPTGISTTSNSAFYKCKG